MARDGNRRRVAQFVARCTWLPLILAGLASAQSPLWTQAARFEVAERWATKGSPDVGEFGAVTGMAEAADGRIWVADGRFGLIHVLSPAGLVVETVGRRGGGPGEFLLPGRLVAALGGIAAHDEGRSSVELFEDGRWVRRIRLATQVSNPKGFAALPRGRWLVSGGIEGNAYSLHQFDSLGALWASWFPIPQTKNPRAAVLVAGGPVAVSTDGTMLFARAAPHGVFRFDLDSSGSALDTVATLPDILPAVGDDFIQERGGGANVVRSFRWFFPQFRAVLPVGAGRILNVVTLYDRGESVWYLFGPTGDMRAATVVKGPYEPWGLTADGDVLASYRDSTTGESVAVRLAVQLAVGVPAGPAVELAPLLVTAPEANLPVARLEGFYQRVEKGHGRYVTRQEIEKRRPRDFFQTIQGLPGLQVDEGKRLVLNTRMHCTPALWLDGAFLGTADFQHLRNLPPPSQIEGVEYYRGPAETPFEFAAFQVSPRCGVLAIWTRSG